MAVIYSLWRIQEETEKVSTKLRCPNPFSLLQRDFITILLKYS